MLATIYSENVLNEFTVMHLLENVNLLNPA